MPDTSRKLLADERRVLIELQPFPDHSKQEYSELRSQVLTHSHWPKKMKIDA